MPFYEYQCKRCGHHLEAMQKVNDKPLRKCPDCGKPALERLMSAPVFRLKGAGWYETDFKSDQEGKRNLADNADADKPAEDKKAAADATTPAAPDATASKDDKKPADKSAAPVESKSAPRKPKPKRPARKAPARAAKKGKTRR